MLIRGFAYLLLLFLLWGCAPASKIVEDSAEKETGVRGLVADSHGQPVSNAWVYVYRNTSSSLRGPADFAAKTGSDGRYFLDLVEGRYYLIARWRRAGGEAGPPQAGDAWALYAHNPVEVLRDQTARADFTLQGVQAGQPALLRSGSLGQGRTGFTGLLTDGDGRPLAGAFALAYSDTDFRRMPDFTSALVGSDGRFQLYLPKPGRYCLAARTRTRGQPIAGEPYGQLGEGEAGCRDAVENRLLDVGEIRLTPYMR